jgi:hypothetical protein
MKRDIDIDIDMSLRRVRTTNAKQQLIQQKFFDKKIKKKNFHEVFLKSFLCVWSICLAIGNKIKPNKKKKHLQNIILLNGRWILRRDIDR